MRRILIGFLVATTLLVPACKKKTEGGNVVQLGADDPGLVAAAAEAKRRWPEFVAAFNEHRPGRKCAVKYAAPIKGGGDEQIWIMVTALGSGTISGTLGNDPVEDIGLKLGDAVTIQTGDVKDWLFTDGQSMTGGFSIATLRNAAGKREQFTDGQSMTGGSQSRLSRTPRASETANERRREDRRSPRRARILSGEMSEWSIEHACKTARYGRTADSLISTTLFGFTSSTICFVPDGHSTSTRTGPGDPPKPKCSPVCEDEA